MRRPMNLLFARIREFTNSISATNDIIRSLTRYSELGTLLIMLIQLLQEFINFFYLKHLLIMLGITEMVIYFMIYGCSYHIVKQSKEDYASTFPILMENHNLFMLNIAIPLVLFFDTSIVQYTSAITENEYSVSYIKKAAILWAFMAIFIMRLGYRICINRQTNSNPAKKRLIPTDELYHGTINLSFFLNVLVCLCIVRLLSGMKDDMELLETICIFGCAFGFLIILFSVIGTHTRRKLYIWVAFIATAFAIRIYSLYLDLGHENYSFGDSVYFCETQIDQGHTEIYYCFEEPHNLLGRMTCYEITYDENGNLTNYNIATRFFFAHKWVRGFFTWYDYSKDETTMSVSDLKKDEFPVDLSILRNQEDVIDEDTTRISKIAGGIAQLAIIGDEYIEFMGHHLTKLKQLPPDIAMLKNPTH